MWVEGERREGRSERINTKHPPQRSSSFLIHALLLRLGFRVVPCVTSVCMSLCVQSDRPAKEVSVEVRDECESESRVMIK